MTGPIQPVADRPAVMIQREMRQSSAARKGETLFQRAALKRRPCRKQGLREEVLFHGRQFFQQPVKRDPRKRMNVHDTEEIGQPDNVVQVGVGEKDVEFRLREIFARPIRRRAGVEHHATLRQHKARRVPPVVGVIAGSAQQDESHDRELDLGDSTRFPSKRLWAVGVQPVEKGGQAPHDMRLWRDWHLPVRNDMRLWRDWHLPVRSQSPFSTDC